MEGPGLSLQDQVSVEFVKNFEDIDSVFGCVVLKREMNLNSHFKIWETQNFPWVKEN